MQDKDKRENLDAVVKQARIELLRGMNLPTSTPDDHVKLKGLSPSWKQQLKDQTKAMLIDEELRRRRHVSSLLAPSRTVLTLSIRAVKLAMANEGREAQQKEEEVTTRKRKAEDDKAWEGTSHIIDSIYSCSCLCSRETRGTRR